MQLRKIIRKLEFCDDTFLGANSQTAFTVTIVSSPAGIPVSGSINTFDYPILSNVNLTCDVTSVDGSSFTVNSYQWNTTECYTHLDFNDGNPSCFPHNQTSQSVTDDDVTADDAGTITCTVTINGNDYASEPFTLRISGEHLQLVCMSCIILCTTYMQLLYVPYRIAPNFRGKKLL